MRRTKRYPLCLTCFPQKNPELSGSRDHGASGHPAGFHVQDPAVSDFYVEPKGGAALCRLTSVLFGPPSGGLRKSVGAGLSSRRPFGPTRGRRARGLLRSLLSGARRAPEPPPAPTRWSLRSPRTLDLDGAETTSQLPIRYFSSSNQFTTIRNRSRSTAPPAWAAGDTDVTSCVVTIRSPSGWRDQLNGL